MKKFLIALIGASTIAGSAIAQDGLSNFNPNRIRFGVHIDPTISWMKPTATKEDNYAVKNDGSKIGFTYGLMAEYFFARNYGIVSGLHINTTGGKQTSTIITKPTTPTGDYVNSATFKYSLQYLELPVALKLRTDDVNGFRFFGQLGATMGINIGKKVTYDVDFYSYPAGKDSLVGDSGVKLKGSLSAAPIFFQMNLGAGVEYPLGNKMAAYFGIFFNNGFAPDATRPDKFDSNDLGYGKASFSDGNTRLNNLAFRFGLFF
jgi:hypothetical protein